METFLASCAVLFLAVVLFLMLIYVKQFLNKKRNSPRKEMKTRTFSNKKNGPSQKEGIENIANREPKIDCFYCCETMKAKALICPWCRSYIPNSRKLLAYKLRVQSEVKDISNAHHKYAPEIKEASNYWIGGDYEKAVTIWTKNVFNGDQIIAGNLGFAYFLGLGTTESHVKGKELLTISACISNRFAQLILGHFYSSNSKHSNPLLAKYWLSMVTTENTKDVLFSMANKKLLTLDMPFERKNIKTPSQDFQYRIQAFRLSLKNQLVEAESQSSRTFNLDILDNPQKL